MSLQRFFQNWFRHPIGSRALRKSKCNGAIRPVKLIAERLEALEDRCMLDIGGLACAVSVVPNGDMLNITGSECSDKVTVEFDAGAVGRSDDIVKVIRALFTYPPSNATSTFPAWQADLITPAFSIV